MVQWQRVRRDDSNDTEITSIGLRMKKLWLNEVQVRQFRESQSHGKKEGADLAAGSSDTWQWSGNAMPRFGKKSRFYHLNHKGG